MKHTPGPWSFYDDSNDGKTNRIEIVAIGKTVARIYHSVPDEDLPNARLIAAAPCILTALQLMVERFIDTEGIYGSYENEALDAAYAAIRKATGDD